MCAGALALAAAVVVCLGAAVPAHAHPTHRHAHAHRHAQAHHRAHRHRHDPGLTVSAWVNLMHARGSRTLVRERRGRRFALWLRDGRFAFKARPGGARAATFATAGRIIPQPREWYQLTGVYDARTRTAELFVNGREAQTRHVQGRRAAGTTPVPRRPHTSFRAHSVLAHVDRVHAYAKALKRPQIAKSAGPGELTVDAAQPGPAINPTQFGTFLEETNHAGDGGLDAQMIRNSDIKENLQAPVAWQTLNSGGGEASIGVDGSQPLNNANPLSLRLSIKSLPAGGSAGLDNVGYSGIPVEPSTSYSVSFFAKSSQPSTGPLTVSLQSDTGQTWAAATITGVTSDWAQYTATLSTGPGTPPSTTNRFAISTSDPAAANTTMWFTVVTVFPPTYDGIDNGLRSDLMQDIAGLRPGYMRIPGGNYLEGNTPGTRFKWQTTIGPLQDRPGHYDSAWGYWSDDYLGLLEYLEAAEEAGAQPLLVVWDGLSLNSPPLSPTELAPYVADAVDEIHYAVDPPTTYWGALRAQDGHPTPFDLMGVEIGNEDGKDATGSYNAYRYPMFYDAIKAAFPAMPVVATTRVTSRPADLVDKHYYNDNPEWFAQNAHRFDDREPSSPRVLIGEYAARQGRPGGTLADALGEAAFLTGLERDADVVAGASYGPLLGNVGEANSLIDLIGFDGLRSYESPSYYAEQMLGTAHGDHVIGSQLSSGPGTLFEVASQDPTHTYVAVVNDGPRPAPTEITLEGTRPPAGGTATVLTGDPAATNSLADPTAVAPATAPLSGLGTSFSYTFAPDSVTVLELDA